MLFMLIIKFQTSYSVESNRNKKTAEVGCINMFKVMSDSICLLDFLLLFGIRLCNCNHRIVHLLHFYLYVKILQPRLMLNA